MRHRSEGDRQNRACPNWVSRVPGLEIKPQLKILELSFVSGSCLEQVTTTSDLHGCTFSCLSGVIR